MNNFVSNNRHRMSTYIFFQLSHGEAVNVTTCATISLKHRDTVAMKVLQPLHLFDRPIREKMAQLSSSSMIAAVIALQHLVVNVHTSLMR